MRAHVERVEIVGLDEAYLDLDGLFSPRAAMRRLLAEIKSETQLTLLGRHRPEQARGQGRLRRREARRLRRAHAASRRARASPPRRPGSFPASGRRPPRALPSWACATLAALAAAPEQLLVERFGPNLGRELRRRARFEHDGEIGAARKVVSESRERTFDTRRQRRRADARAARR